LRITRLFTTEKLAEGSTVALDKESSHYLSRVMRYKTGDKFVLFNGDGHDYQASIVNLDKIVNAEVEFKQKNNTESPLSVTLVQALAKGTKLDLVIQKATELGATKISPINTERSVLQIDQSRLNKKRDHWKKIAISASAQCNRSVVPEVTEVTQFEEWMTHHSNEHIVLIDPTANQSFQDVEIKDHINLMIGPEGGFSESELALAIKVGADLVKCGPRIMRTETAGLASLAILQALFGDFR